MKEPLSVAVDRKITVQLADEAKAFPLQLSVTTSKLPVLAPVKVAEPKVAEDDDPVLVSVTVTLEPGEDPPLISIFETELGENERFGPEKPDAVPARAAEAEIELSEVLRLAE